MASTMATTDQMSSTSRTTRLILSSEKTRSIYDSRRQRLERVKRSGIVGLRNQQGGGTARGSALSASGARPEDDNRRFCSPSTSPERSTAAAGGSDLHSRSRERFRNRMRSSSSTNNNNGSSSGGKNRNKNNPKSPISILEFNPSDNDELYLSDDIVASPKSSKAGSSDDYEGNAAPDKRSCNPAISPTSVVFDYDPSVPFDEQMDDAVLLTTPQRPEKSHGRRDDEARLSELKFDLASLSIFDRAGIFLSTAATATAGAAHHHDEYDLDSLAYSDDGSDSTPSL